MRSPAMYEIVGSGVGGRVGGAVGSGLGEGDGDGDSVGGAVVSSTVGVGVGDGGTTTTRGVERLSAIAKTRIATGTAAIASCRLSKRRMRLGERAAYARLRSSRYAFDAPMITSAIVRTSQAEPSNRSVTRACTSDGKRIAGSGRSTRPRNVNSAPSEPLARMSTARS